MKSYYFLSERKIYGTQHVSLLRTCCFGRLLVLLELSKTGKIPGRTTEASGGRQHAVHGSERKFSSRRQERRREVRTGNRVFHGQ